MTQSQPVMQPTSPRFLDFPREIRDAVYTHMFRGKYTVRIPQHLYKQKDLVKASSWPRVAILQTSKQVGEEASQLLYAVGSFCFPSDLVMDRHISLFGHKFHLLRTIELHFDMYWYDNLNKGGSLEGIVDDTCTENISVLVAGQGHRRYMCTLVFEECEMSDPSKAWWWDALEELDVFERVVVEVPCLEVPCLDMAFQPFTKTYARGKEVNGRSERWDEIKQDVRVHMGSVLDVFVYEQV